MCKKSTVRATFYRKNSTTVSETIELKSVPRKIIEDTQRLFNLVCNKVGDSNIAITSVETLT